MFRHLIVLLCISTCTSALEAELYGSARLQLESVMPKNVSSEFDEYIDFRDAYSRVGVKLNYQFEEDWNIALQYEKPLDLANQKIQLAYDNADHTRISKIQLNSPIGKLWYGKGWLGFYNNISYSVDRFSSYYSGWATFTSFREKETLYYESPQLNGFKFTYVTIGDNGSDEFGIGHSNRNQYVASRQIDKWSFNFAIDELNKGTDQKIIGTAISYNAKQWYLGAKVEQFVSDDITGSGDSYGADGTKAVNVYGRYSLDDKNILKIMFANVDGTYGDNIIHIGYDYLYSDKIKLFAEFYSEETTAAISERRHSTFLGVGDFNQPADSGGSVFALGVRYDFSWKNY